MKPVAIFLPVYNEEKYIAKTVSSILQQDYPDFDLIISENHSNDNTLSILRELASHDARITIIRPEENLNSYGNFKFAADHVKGKGYFASMMLGGHDMLSHTVLSSSVKYLMENSGCVIAYQRDSFEIDENDNATRRWPVCHVSGNMNAAFDAILTIITLMYNTPIFGLWRQSVRDVVTFRHPCVGGDHLYVAEAAAHGSIVPIDGAQIYLRRAPPNANYLKKHFADRRGDDAAAQDMSFQLSWLSAIVDLATAGHIDLSRELLRASAFSLYLIRYVHHFQTFDSTLSTYAERPDIKQIIDRQIILSLDWKQLFKHETS